MISTLLADRRWFYLLLIAIVLQILYSFKYIQRDHTHLLNEDALSAIRRARTNICKEELEEFASNINQSINQLGSFQRTCPLDSGELQFQKIGCIRSSSIDKASSNLLKLDDLVEDIQECLDACFSYGHRYGGHLESDGFKQCYCGDLENKNILVEDFAKCDQEGLRWFRVNHGIFYPKTTKCVLSSANNRTSKIAFILTLRGRSVLQIKRLLSNIYSPSHIYYVHIDNQDDYLFNQLLFLGEKYQNVKLTRDRQETVWGGPKLLSALLDAFDSLSSHDWDYVINLSETDFPVKSLDYLESFLTSKDCIFLRSHTLKGYNFIRKQGLDRAFYQCERRVWRLGNRKLPKGIVYSGGSDWFALPRRFIDYIISEKDKLHGLTAPLIRLYNFTLLPAESFFHTLALNSQFCGDVVDNNLRATNWQRKQSGCKCQQKDIVDWCGCSPLIYRRVDKARLKNVSLTSDIFFSRKFEATVSQSIINYVEQGLCRREQCNRSSDDYWLNVYDEKYPGNGSIYVNLAHHVSIQLGSKDLKLSTVDQYFKYDEYVGFVLRFCSGDVCLELLLEKAKKLSKNGHFDQLYGNFTDYKLVKLDIDHGFDANEKIFRNHNPIEPTSDIAIYHEWIVNKTVANRELRFNWIGPRGMVKFIQNVKLKAASKQSRLIFVHKPNIKRPLEPGLWTLEIASGNSTCWIEEFLVIDRKVRIDQHEFNRFYAISGICYEADQSCSLRKWSLNQKRTVDNVLLNTQGTKN